MLLKEKEEQLNIMQLNKEFNWYNNTFTDILHNAVNSFWMRDIDCKLFAINNDLTLFKTEEFFVAKIPVNKNVYITIRLSKSIIENLLDILGKSVFDFNINKLSDLEIKILNAFSNTISEEIIKNIQIPSYIPEEDLEVTNLIFYTILPGKKYGKIVISIPKVLLNPIPMENEKSKIDIYGLSTATSEVNIEVGKTKMSLNELKHLAKEDIVLLENSDLTKLTIDIRGKSIPFNITPDPALILNLDNNGEESMDTNELSQDLWDNIQVDVSAEFDKVKLTLGELKQITEGLVIDMGAIYDNKIYLKVENKYVAKGELIIVNDRYGMKIEEMINEETQTSLPEGNQQVQPSAQTTQELQPENQEQIASEEEDEEFNYDDFELDDEDI